MKHLWKITIKLLIIITLVVVSLLLLDAVNGPDTIQEAVENPGELMNWNVSDPVFSFLLPEEANPASNHFYVVNPAKNSEIAIVEVTFYKRLAFVANVHYLNSDGEVAAMTWHEGEYRKLGLHPGIAKEYRELLVREVAKVARAQAIRDGAVYSTSKNWHRTLRQEIDRMIRARNF